MNKSILMGRITRDIELKQTSNGTATTSFTIAVNRRFAKEGQQTADFINCVAWRGTAEFISKYFNKGSMIAVVGSLQSRSWEGQDGKKQYVTEVNVDEVYFAGGKKETPTGGNSDDNSALDGFAEVPPGEDDLPF